MTVSEHFKNPRNVGEMHDATVVAEETNPVCGDRLRIYLRLKGDDIEEVRFLAYGCPPSIACGSALTELVKQKKVNEALRVTRQQIVDAVGGLSSRKQHAATLAMATLRSALEQADQSQ